MPSAEPLMIRNTTRGPTTFTNSAQGQDYVEWQGAGDGNGGDVQPVSESWMSNPQFRRMLTRGIFVVEEGSEEVKAILDKQRAEYERSNEERANASKQNIDQAPNNDMLVRTCLGPGSKPNELCGTDVSVKVQDQDKKPPLCTSHEHLAGQFVPEVTDRIVNGKQEVVWKSIQMGARATDQN